MPCTAAHYPLEGTTSPLPTTEGSDIECSRVNLQYTSLDYLVYSLTPWNKFLNTIPLYSKKAIIFVFVFEGRVRCFFEAGEFLSLGSSLCLFVGGVVL